MIRKQSFHREKKSFRVGSICYVLSLWDGGDDLEMHKVNKALLKSLGI